MQAPITGWIQKHRGKPLLFHDKCPGFFYVHYTTPGTYSFTSHPKDKAITVKCLAQGHKRRDRPGRDSNPHSDNTGTWVQCARPLSHDTRIIVYLMIQQGPDTLGLWTTPASITTSLCFIDQSPWSDALCWLLLIWGTGSHVALRLIRLISAVFCFSLFLSAISDEYIALKKKKNLWFDIFYKIVVGDSVYQKLSAHMNLWWDPR